MTGDISHSCMHQDIFHRGLPTETISLYLLCCGILDAGQQATRGSIAERWNAGEDLLTESLKTLLADGILATGDAPEDPAAAFTVTTPDRWRLPAT